MNQIVQASEVAGNSRIILMGDFNLKEINWLENEIEGGPQSLPFLFNECTKDCFLHQHVSKPTNTALLANFITSRTSLLKKIDTSSIAC